MTRVFVLTNHKGGVGKSTSATTIALGIAAVLRRAGAANSRVLLIDTDSQGHATLITMLGLSVPKSMGEKIVAEMAADVADFREKAPPPAGEGVVTVVQADAKGINMVRPGV